MAKSSSIPVVMKQEEKKRCNHRYRLSAFSSQTLTFSCNKCNERFERKPTATEQREISEYQAAQTKHSTRIHRLWHDFSRRFMNGTSGGFKLYGADLQDAVRKWAQKHPEVSWLGCDDRMFMTSNLVLIPHQADGFYMGTTVVYLPQCTGDHDKAAQFFLYPGHVGKLLSSLLVCEKNARQYRRRLPFLNLPWKPAKTVAKRKPTKKSK